MATTGKAPIFFPVVFGFADLVIFLILINLLFKSSRITADASGLTVATRWLLIRSIKNLSAADVASITTKIGMTSGQNVYYDIHIIARAGRDITAASSIRDKKEAEWLAAEMKTSSSWTKSHRRLLSAHDAPNLPRGHDMKSSPPVPSVRSQPVPTRWRREVERVLISEKQIARRIREMSVEIERDFDGREMVVISLLNGTVMFQADLIRHLSLPLRLDFMGVSSYGLGTDSGN